MKALRVAGIVVLALVAAVALLVGGAMTLAQTRWGGDVVRRIALPRINAAIAGQLTFERFRFRGRGLALERVELRDPGGVLVARIARVDVTFNPVALVRRRVDVSSLTIDRPELWLVQDANGSNLTRALAPRQRRPAPATPAAPGVGPGLTIDLRALALQGGTVDYRAAVADAAPRHVRLSELRIRAAMRYATATAALWAEADVGFDGGGLVARIASPGGDERDVLTVNLDHLQLPTRVVRAFVPVFRSDVTARGTLRKRGDVASIDVGIAAGGGRVDARGDVDLAGMRAEGPGLVVRGSRIDLNRLIDDAPRSDLAFVLTARGGGHDLASADGSLDFELPPSRLDGHTLGPVRFTARAVGGRYEVAKLVAAAPGIEVTGNVVATAHKLDGRVRIEASDLTATARSLAPPHRAPPVDLGGRGRVDLALGGTPRSPSLRAAGRMPTLRIGNTRIDALTLTAVVPNLRTPDAATVEAAAPVVFVGGQSLRGVTLSGTTTGTRIAVAAGTTAPYPFQLAVTGRRSRTAATLDTLALRYPEAAWSLARPARIELGDRRIAVRGFVLHAGRQALEIDVVKTGKATRGQVAIANLDLGKLPRALVANARALAGIVDADVRVDVGGSQPKLALDARARGLVVDRQLAGDVTLSVRGEGERPSRAEVAVTLSTSRGATPRTQVTITTPLSLAAVLRHPPTSATLLRTPFDVRGDVEAFPLALVGKLARYPLPVGGAVSAELALAGTALDPKGSIGIDVAGATAGKFPPTDARVEVDLARSSIDARVRVTRKGNPLLALESHLGAGPLALRAPELLAVAPLRVRAVVGPLGLSRLGLPPDSERAAPRVLKGRLHADLAIDGSLRDPRVLAHADVADIRLDKILIGYGRIEARYADRNAEVDARLTSANGGSMHAVARTTADLGYPAIASRGIDVPELPLDVRLDAQDFDVQGLSGAAQALRTVGGLVTASAVVRGKVADPQISGRFEWKRGVVAVTGFGEYRDIHLALHGDREKLVLDELFARSGGGQARLTGDASHADGHGYAFTAKAALSHFPVYQEGQALAQVTIDAALSGNASPLRTRAKIDLDDARIELSDAKRKQLQSLKVPADIVLVDDGQPLNRAQAERLRALLAAREARAQAAGDPQAAQAARDARQAALTVEPSSTSPKLVLAVNAPRQLWVTGKDAYMELGLGPGFRVVIGDKPRVHGQVIVRRGRINVFGRRFDIKADSTLQFSGSPDRPDVDVSAQYRNDAADVTVLLTAKGPLDHMTIAVTSPNRPELAESQLYTLILTGHLQLGGGTSGSSSPTAQAASLLGGMLAAQLQKTLANKLPLDVLTIDAGKEGLTGTQVEAGRYLTDKLYVGYVGRVGADPTRNQNRNAVHVEYQLSSRWGIDGEYGDVGTGSADLMWKKNY